MNPPPLTSSVKRHLLREMRTAPVFVTNPFMELGFAACTDCGSAISPMPESKRFHERRCKRLRSAA